MQGLGLSARCGPITVMPNPHSFVRRRVFLIQPSTPRVFRQIHYIVYVLLVYPLLYADISVARLLSRNAQERVLCVISTFLLDGWYLLHLYLIFLSCLPQCPAHSILPMQAVALP